MLPVDRDEFICLSKKTLFFKITCNGFYFSKKYDEGTTEPFFARMMSQIWELRNSVFDQQSISIFDKFYDPILQNLIECRLAKINCEKLINEHNKKIETKEIISFRKNAIEIYESIDTELNKNFKDFFIKGKIAVQNLDTLFEKMVGENIEFCFKNDKTFEKGSIKFLEKNKGEKFEDFIQMLKEDRLWYKDYNDIRNKIEHHGFNLPNIQYINVEQSGKIIALFPTINNQPLVIVLNLLWNNIFEFIEDIIVYLFEFKLEPPIKIICIPEDERNKSCPIKYKLSMNKISELQ